MLRIDLAEIIGCVFLTGFAFVRGQTQKKGYKKPSPSPSGTAVRARAGVCGGDACVKAHVPPLGLGQFGEDFNLGSFVNCIPEYKLGYHRACSN